MFYLLMRLTSDDDDDAIGGSRSCIHLILEFDSYNLQKVPSLLPTDDPARVHFSRWYMDQCLKEAHFPCYALFTDEADFT